MVENRGNAVSYSTGRQGIPLPSIDPSAPLHPVHQHRPPKPAGLNWGALTPSCRGCGEPSGELDRADTCPTCRGVPSIPLPTREDAYPTYDNETLADRFTGPSDIPAKEIPAVVTPSGREPVEGTPAYVRRLHEARQQAPAAPTPPVRRVRAKVRQVGPGNVVISLHADASISTVEVAALLTDLLTRLHATPQTPDPAAPPVEPVDRQPARSGPIVATVSTNPGHNGDRLPAAGSVGEADQQRAATKPRRNHRSRLDTHRDAIIAAYQAGDSPATIAARYGVSGNAVRNWIRNRSGIQPRTRSEAQTLAAKTRLTPTQGVLA